jgi:ribosomal protein S18 acetylase RimI-like enzyme
MWEPPGASGHAGLGAALDLPADTLARIEAYERAVYGSMPAEPHWYLGVLATHPQRAGLRLGRSVMGAGLQQAVADGVPAILETVNAANVELYRRSGWEVAATVPFEGLQVRVMSHPGPRADASA